MKKIVLITLAICFSTKGISQKTKKSEKEKLLAELAENSCKCVDSISVYNKSKEDVSKEVNKCIDNQTGAYQLGSKLMGIDSLKETAEEKDFVLCFSFVATLFFRDLQLSIIYLSNS